MKLPKNLKKMYYTKISHDIIFNLTGTAFKTYCYLASASKSKDGTCKIGYKGLAELMNVKSTTTVNATISQLANTDYIEIIKGTGLNGGRGNTKSGYRSRSYRPLFNPEENYVIIHDHLLALASGRILKHKALTGEQLRFLLLLNSNELQESHTFVLNDTMEDALLFFGFALSMQKKHLRTLIDKGYILEKDYRTYELISSYWYINEKKDELINLWNEMCHFWVPLNKIDFEKNIYTEEPINALVQKYPTLKERNVALIDVDSSQEYDIAKSVFSLLSLLFEGNTETIENIIKYYLWLPLNSHHWKDLGSLSLLDYLSNTYPDFNQVCKVIYNADRNHTIDNKLLISTYKSLKLRATKLASLLEE